ncbi:MAG: hypothetical protein EBS19_02265 [Spirochaetia bacterium]|nr:hypothetical protein [Spirochaetia bacterium]
MKNFEILYLTIVVGVFSFAFGSIFGYFAFIQNFSETLTNNTIVYCVEKPKNCEVIYKYIKLKRS